MRVRCCKSGHVTRMFKCQCGHRVCTSCKEVAIKRKPICQK